jgi:predicted nucleic acid-binding protein
VAVIVDTGVFIQRERGGGVLEFSRWSSYGEPCISVITVSELKVGIHRADTEERRVKRQLFVTTVLANVVMLPIDSMVADIHARILAAMIGSGIAIGAHDSWIAATAIKYDCPLLTTNVREFSRVPDLHVLTF